MNIPTTTATAKLDLTTEERLFLAKTQTTKIIASLDRGLKILSQMEAECRAANGGKLPSVLPSELTEKLELWRGLLRRYESAATLEKHLDSIVKAMESGRLAGHV